jgi:hypothetical protein
MWNYLVSYARTQTISIPHDGARASYQILVIPISGFLEAMAGVLTIIYPFTGPFELCLPLVLYIWWVLYF